MGRTGNEGHLIHSKHDILRYKFTVLSISVEVRGQKVFSTHITNVKSTLGSSNGPAEASMFNRDFTICTKQECSKP